MSAATSSKRTSAIDGADGRSRSAPSATRGASAPQEATAPTTAAVAASVTKARPTAVDATQAISGEAARRPPPLGDRVDEHRQEQHDAGDDELRARRQAQQVHAVLDGGDHQRAVQRGDDATRAAE